jgi:hypothetical protein
MSAKIILPSGTSTVELLMLRQRLAGVGGDQ